MPGIEVVSSWMLLRFISTEPRQELHTCIIILRFIDDVPIVHLKKFFLIYFIFCLFRAILTTYGGSQAKGWIGAAAANLHHSHSNARFEPQSVTYTTAHCNTGSLTHWARPGIKPESSWILVGFRNHWAIMGTPLLPFWSEFCTAEIAW